METILVQMSEKIWTMQAVHLACTLARNTGGQVILLRLMPVQHPSYLGTEFGYSEPTRKEWEAIRDYAATAEDYGVPFSVSSMQCLSPLSAVVEAAKEVGADFVFANVPPAPILFLQTFRLWNLARRLRTGGSHLFTLGEADDCAERAPAIALQTHPNRKTHLRPTP